ncbi:MAG: hypothetical protein WC346_18775 [Methanogenium sp.]
MKNSLNIEVNVQKLTESNKFNYDDITNALFFNKPPLLVIQPFKDLKNITVQNTTLSLSLSLSYKPLTIYESLKKAFPENVFNLFLKLPSWMLGRIIERYKEGVDEWANYLMDNLKDYCKTFESKWHWNTIKTLSTTNIIKEETLSVEKTLWMYFCEILEKEENIDLILKIRESILPWMNNELWQQVQKKKENTRENVAFEQIKSKILFNSTIDDEDLDIIR